MFVVLRSTVMNTLESGLSFTLVHLHLSHIILRKSAIYISLSASFTCQKRIWGGNFFKELVNVGKNRCETVIPS